MPSYPQFAPRYLAPTELNSFGLPTSDVQPDIMTLVEMASLIIDEECGRVDGDGNGSLAYTTWVHRCLLQTRNRNLVETPMKPLVAVDGGTVQALKDAISGDFNWTYTGVQANTVASALGGGLVPIIGCSGRYGYTRQDMSIAYPDLFAFINPLNLVTMFGGPAPWVPIDVTQIDFDPRTGELWIPAGLQLQRYSEVMLIYNSGWNPLAMPRIIKHVCASVVKNALAQGDATTFLTGLSMAKSGLNIRFNGGLLDPTLSAMLTPFKNVRSY